jgi:hypothetical protein
LGRLNNHFQHWSGPPAVINTAAACLQIALSFLLYMVTAYVVHPYDGKSGLILLEIIQPQKTDFLLNRIDDIQAKGAFLFSCSFRRAII